MNLIRPTYFWSFFRRDASLSASEKLAFLFFARIESNVFLTSRFQPDILRVPRELRLRRRDMGICILKAKEMFGVLFSAPSGAQVYSTALRRPANL